MQIISSPSAIKSIQQGVLDNSIDSYPNSDSTQVHRLWKEVPINGVDIEKCSLSISGYRTLSYGSVIHIEIEKDRLIVSRNDEDRGDVREFFWQLIEFKKAKVQRGVGTFGGNIEISPVSLDQSYVNDLGDGEYEDQRMMQLKENYIEIPGDQNQYDFDRDFWWEVISFD